MVATDRRSAGAQVDDQVDRGQGRQRRRARCWASAGTSTSPATTGCCLLTGEVPTEADKAAVGKAVSQIENVRSIVNELAVMPNSSSPTRSNDSHDHRQGQGRVRRRERPVGQAIKVVTERGMVYLMGLVTETEAKRAVEITRGVGGVQKVVRVFEIVTAADAGRQPGGHPGQCACGASPESARRRATCRRVIRLDVSQRLPASGLHVGVELVHQRGDGHAGAVAPRFVEHQRRGPCASSRRRSRSRSGRRSSSARGGPSASSARRPCRSPRAPPSCRGRPSRRRRSPRPGPAPARRSRSG